MLGPGPFIRPLIFKIRSEILLMEKIVCYRSSHQRCIYSFKMLSRELNGISDNFQLLYFTVFDIFNIHRALDKEGVVDDKCDLKSMVFSAKRTRWLKRSIRNVRNAVPAMLLG